MHPLFNLNQNVVIVTGATRGIGLATATTLAQLGARVVISSEDELACTEISSELQSYDLDVIGVPCDVRDRSQLEHLVATTLEEFGQLDALVCCAGVAPHSGAISKATDDDWDTTMTVNLQSALWLSNIAIPHMLERGGSVVFVSSIASVRGNKNIGLYGISKAGLAQLARNLAVEWGAKNLRVNAVSPGLIRTDFAKTMLENPDIMERRLGLTPLRRVGDPLEVAGVIAMLVSKSGAFITGQNLIVDGGTVISDGN
jgi:NAD(P)-dependent dehydrogenase (short-subunit alcohol dehydrogenase family)